MHTNQQQKIISTLNAQHSSQSKQSAMHQQQIMSRLSSASLEVIARQKELRRLAKQNRHQSSSVGKSVAFATQTSLKQHEQTRASISTLISEIKQLKVSLGLESAQPTQYDRNIFFYGEHSNMIMAYLLPLQSDLEYALESLMNDHSQEISVSHVQWLQTEFRRLIASAAQESATRYPGSTARSTDQWSYPLEPDSSSQIYVERNLKRSAPCHQENNQPKRRGAIVPQSSVRPANQLWSVETPSGSIHLSIPPAKSARTHDQIGEQVCLSCMITQNRSTFAVNTQFRRVSNETSQPKVHTQLSVFTRVEDVSDVYMRLFDRGTITEIDFAYRNGTISPFHVDDVGSNYYFRVRTICLLLPGNRHRDLHTDFFNARLRSGKFVRTRFTIC
jgi:hypothetical protein